MDHGRHPFGESPFALSAAVTAAVEGIRDFQLPFLGSMLLGCCLPVKGGGSLGENCLGAFWVSDVLLAQPHGLSTFLVVVRENEARFKPGLPNNRLCSLCLSRIRFGR